MRDKVFCLKFRSQGFDETLLSTSKDETDEAWLRICVFWSFHN